MSSVGPFRHVGYPLRVHAGDDAISRLPEEVDRTGAKRAMIVCGQTVARRTSLVDRVKEALGERFAGVFDGAKTGSPVPAVERGVDAARELEADIIIAAGGGSAVVTTRAIIILLAEGGTARDHATRYPAGKPPVSPRLMRPKIPNLIVLTTPTTAANRSGTAVIDEESGHRLEMFDPKTRPGAVFWDSEALLTASPDLCLSAAGSLFSGVVGALQAAALNPLAEGDLRQSLRLLQENLLLVREKPGEASVRVNLCAASLMYNRAWDSGAGGNALGVVSALAHSLDTRYPQVDHGAAYSIMTAAGMRFNRQANPEGQARFAEMLGVGKKGADASRMAEAAAEEVERTFQKLSLPLRLRDVGVPEAGIAQIAGDAMTDFALHRNVRRVEHAGELAELVRQVW